MLKIYKIITITLVVLLCHFSLAFAAVLQKIPGTALYATAPKGFVLDNKLNGFVNAKTGVSILVATLPPSTDNWKETFVDYEKFAKVAKGFKFTIHQTYEVKTFDSYSLTVYQGVQSSDEGDYNKWISIFFVDNAAYPITIQAPKKSNFSDEMAKDFYQSISLAQNVAVEEQLATLPFSFEIVQPFQFVGSLMNSAALLTIAPIGNEKQNRPDIMISKGLENVEGQSLEQNLQNYLQSLKGTVDDVKNNITTTIEFAGLTAIKLQAEAIVRDEKSDILIYATITKDGHPFYMHVTGPQNSLKNYADVIDKIALSVELRD